MSNTTTLWQLLHEQPVIIPMIQRDYAQGRKGKEHIRETFLTSLESCLRQGTRITLDFVYGNLERGKFYPLDGQQRLTTLWLLHWYLAFRLNKLKAVKDKLEVFSYQTRDSSRDFCKQLCEEMSGVAPEQIDDVVKYIKGQTWFFTEWTQDPTIDAMLRTLGGDKNGEPKQNIQSIFSTDLLDTYWKNLTEINCVVFEQMVIGSEQLPISDDLYIKMNARGKKLTDFENFKADWIAHIHSLGNKEDGQSCSQKYPKRIDNEWTDVFWNSANKTPGFKGKIDTIFFAFINRFVFNQLCLDTRVSSYTHYDSSKYDAKDKLDIQRIQKHFDLLYGRNSSNDDSQIEYTGFEAYREYLTEENMAKLDKIFSWLEEQSVLDLVNDLSFGDEKKSTYLIPQCDPEGVFRGIGQIERLHFHAICLFLEDPNWDKLDEWKYLVWKLTENAAIDNIENMINCLRAVNELGIQLRAKNWEIIDNLPAITLDISANTPLGNQWAEEQAKAAMIQQDRTLQKDITKAEKYAFFKGTIRFLFTDPDGSINWENFTAKFTRAKRLFEGEKVSVNTVKDFLKRFSSFEDLSHVDEKKAYFFTTIGDDRRDHCWKKGILCNTDVQPQVHALLMNAAPIAKDRYLEFLDSCAVEKICNREHNDNYRYYNSRDMGVHREQSRQSEGVFVSSERRKRNALFLLAVAEKEIELLEDIKEIDLGYNFLWGKEIVFIYNGNPYCWYVAWGGANWIRAVNPPNKEIEWTLDMDDMDMTKLLTKLPTL